MKIVIETIVHSLKAKFLLLYQLSLLYDVTGLGVVFFLFWNGYVKCTRGILKVENKQRSDTLYLSYLISPWR